MGSNIKPHLYNIYVAVSCINRVAGQINKEFRVTFQILMKLGAIILPVVLSSSIYQVTILRINFHVMYSAFI